jgi:hypothetical protein
MASIGRIWTAKVESPMIPLLPRNAITPCTAGNSMKTISRVSSTVTNERYTISSISTMTPTVTPITLRALLLPNSS